MDTCFLLANERIFLMGAHGASDPDRRHRPDAAWPRLNGTSYHRYGRRSAGGLMAVTVILVVTHLIGIW
jgi:hypothetical protein